MRRHPGEGSFYQHRGRWVAVAELPAADGKRDRREFTSTDPQEALAKRSAFLAERAGGFTPGKGPRQTAGDYLRTWITVTAPRRLAPSTLAGYEQKLADHVIPYFDRMPLADITEETIERWHDHLAAKPLAPASVAQCHAILRTALNTAVTRGRLPRNPCTLAPPPQTPHLEPALADAEQVAAIIARCATWPGGARWILALATGARQGEVLALRWANVQLSAPASIRVSESACRVRGELIVKAPKSEKSRRTIAIGAATVAALREHRQRQVINIVNDLVFTAADGGPVHPRADRQDWADLLADLGLPHFTVHSLRHLAGTLLLEAGVDVRVVQEVLGHASPAFTARTYQHVRPVLHQRAAAALDSIIGGSG
jgi:integrase